MTARRMNIDLEHAATKRGRSGGRVVECNPLKPGETPGEELQAPRKRSCKGRRKPLPTAVSRVIQPVTKGSNQCYKTTLPLVTGLDKL
jgi:hypothetical protein